MVFIMGFLHKNKAIKDDFFPLWISNDNVLPELQYLSIKAMILKGMMLLYILIMIWMISQHVKNI